MNINAKGQKNIRAMLTGNNEIIRGRFIFRYVNYGGIKMIEQCQPMIVNGRTFYRMVDFFIASR